MRKFRTTETFIEDAKKVHGDKYDYSEVVFTTLDKKVKIKCKRRGNVFYKEAHGHLRGYGCPRCNTLQLTLLCKLTQIYTMKELTEGRHIF